VLQPRGEVVVSKLPVKQLKTGSKEMDLGDAKVFHLPDWNKLSHPQRLAVLRQIAMMRARDPRIAKLAVSIFKASGVQPRKYDQQAAALLQWVQNPKNCYYVNEAGERLQDPIHTIKIGHGDCDDSVLLLTCLFESVGLPWKLVLSGTGPSGKVRYIEGEKVPSGVRWTHIYCMVGTPAFNPTTWYFCETTIQGVPLGWDVVSGDHSYLPEMGGKKGDAVRVVSPNPAPNHYRPAPLPAKNRQSPAYAMAYSGAFPAAYGSAYGAPEVSALEAPSLVGTTVGAYMAEEAVARAESQSWLDWRKWGAAIATGVLVSVGTTLTLDYLRGTGSWAGKGVALDRWKAWATPKDPTELI
jgi:hypothetical protein